MASSYKKIAFLGEGGVGKSTILRLLTDKRLNKTYRPTIGVNFGSLKVNEYDVALWDIAGQDSFHFLRPAFFKNSKAAIIVSSLEDNRLGRKSFDHISDWHEEIKKYCGNIPIIFFANKVDLIDENSLNHSEFETIINDNNYLGYYITSALTGKGVIEAFSAIIESLYHRHKSLPAEI